MFAREPDNDQRTLSPRIKIQSNLSPASILKLKNRVYHFDIAVSNLLDSFIGSFPGST